MKMTQEMIDAIIQALLDVTEYMSEQDIRGETGLPQERCEEIYKLIVSLRK